ncbi:MAG: CHAP domain-containing protein [Fimbriimonadaceae bacterium]
MRHGWTAFVCGLVLVVGVILWFKIVRYQLPRELPPGECTWYAAARAKESGWDLKFKQQFGRDARKWGELVTNGKLVAEPVVGSLMVLDAWGTNPFGHVAYVEEVADSAHFTVTHANMMVGVKVFSKNGVPIRRVDAELDGKAVSFGEGKADYPVIGFLVMK